MAKRERGPGSIEQQLRSLYPSHPQLHRAVANLARSSYVDLSDLADVHSGMIEKLVPTLFLVALRDKLSDFVRHIVATEMTSNDMVLSCAVKSVTLREENAIPQLEAAYAPMYENVDVDSLSEEPLEVEEKEVEVEDDEAEEEETGSEAGRLLNTSEPGSVSHSTELITLKMYEVREGAAFLESIWGRAGHDKLLERSHYRKLRVLVERLWEAGKTAVMLTGTPGIGKTGFLVFMLVRLLSRYKPVVFKAKSGRSFFFEPPCERRRGTGGIPAGYKCFSLCNDDILVDSAVYFLADGKLPDPPPFFGKALLASILLKENCKDYKKDGRHASLLLPVWSAAEIALAWQEIFDPNRTQLRAFEDEDVGGGEEVAGQDAEDLEDEKQVVHLDAIQAGAGLTLEIVKERYRQWGGTPLYVLERPETDLLGIVAKVKSIQTTVEAAGKEIADADHPSHKLAHMKVKPGYERYGYMFASPYVTELARQKLKTSCNLRLFLTFEGLQAHALNGLKANVFQAEFMDMATGKRKMTVRQVYQKLSRLGPNREKVFEFKQAFHGLFSLKDVPAAALPVNRIIWPSSKIEATFDALKIVRRKGQEDYLELYWVTLSCKRNEHGLKYEAVESVMKLLGVPESRTRVYIACTSELYPSAGYQKWLEPGGRVLKDGERLKRLAGIAQYVLDTGI